VLVIGAGACGLVAALSVKEAGGDCLVVEADAVPSGSTALSAGLIPAAGTRFQREAGIEDDASLFAEDIQRKAKGENPQPSSTCWRRRRSDGRMAGRPVRAAVLLVTDFDYPGHSRRRMHGLPTRSGRELVDRLRAACEEIGSISSATGVPRRSSPTQGVSRGSRSRAPTGPSASAATRWSWPATVMAATARWWRATCPEITGAVWFGHDGNRGDALDWGEALGAESLHLGAYQGHGNVAHPEGILITWAVITEGGIQVNTDGDRFWDESQGYSEAARAVLAQPGGIAWRSSTPGSPGSRGSSRISRMPRRWARFGWPRISRRLRG
jgi:fumarate reductase flavoprotein subunit